MFAKELEISASLDWAAMTIGAALVAEAEGVPRNGSPVLAQGGLVQP